MQPLSSAAREIFANTDFVLTDLDDTLTLDGRLPAASYAALEALQEAGKTVIVVTGRPAGWCDLIARFFPVSAVVGENGAFYFCYDHASRTMLRAFQRTDAERARDRHRLDQIFAGIAARYPEIRLSADQPYRISDIAVDFCEDVPRLNETTIADIVRMFDAGGATAKVSSIHINAWIGDFSKLEMSLRLLRERFAAGSDAVQRAVYVGDSPNDEPMFAHFPLSIGVSNLLPFAKSLRSSPRWITAEPGGLGFAEVVQRILKV
ncbi:MAG: HAD family hydrolase [Deltaproteobacteria bacterium]